MKEQDFWNIVLPRFQTQWEPWVERETHFQPVEREQASRIISANFPVSKIVEAINKDINSGDGEARGQRERFHQRLLPFFVDYFVQETADYMQRERLKKLDSELVKVVKERLVKSVPKMSGIYPC